LLGAELIAAGLGASLSLVAIGQDKRGLTDDDKLLVSIFDRRETNVVVMLLFVASGVVLAAGADAGLFLLLPATLVAFVSGGAERVELPAPAANRAPGAASCP
jgi:hypothetical protein